MPFKLAEYEFHAVWSSSKILNLGRNLFQEIANLLRSTSKLQHDLDDGRMLLTEESQKANRLQMELDAKESEMEQLQQQLRNLLQGSDSASIHSNIDIQPALGSPTGVLIFLGIQLLRK